MINMGTLSESQIKKLEQEIEDYKNALIDLEKRLAESEEKAKEAERLKTAFLSIMSHEIRTPMNGILGFLDLLNNKDLDPGTRENYIEIMNKSGRRLLDTINDIVELSQIESSNTPNSYYPIDIISVLKYQYDFFLPQIQDSGLKLICADLNRPAFYAVADELKIGSILTNLIKNSIKFTTEGEIAFGFSVRGKFLEFWVKDSGAGIEKEKQEKIFDRFVQADTSQNRGYEGAGLGLSISKSYCEQMGGQIWLESDKGEGATFYFTVDFIPHEEAGANAG